MIFHFFLIAFILILYFLCHYSKTYRKKEKDTLFLRCSMLLLFVLVAIRDFDIGSDTPMYLSLFQRCCTYKWDIVKFGGYFEGGYLIFNVLLSYISSSPRFFMVVMSFIFNYLVYRFIKNNSDNYLFSILMYVCRLFFYTSMTMMRQYSAVMIILLFMHFVKKRKFFAFLAGVFLASLFHSTAWIALVIYPLYHLKYTQKRMILMFCVSIIILLFLRPAVNSFMNLIGRANYYESRFGSDSVANTIGFIICFAMFLFALYFRKDNIDNTEYDFYLYILLLTSCINLIATDMNVLSRADYYYSIFSIIMIPNVLNSIKSNNTKKVCGFAVFVLLLTYSSVIIKYRPEWNTAFNYNTSFFRRE